MAFFTIEKQAKANGDFSYRCKIVVKKNNQIIHWESWTFRKKELAKIFSKKIVSEIESNNLGINKAIPLLQINIYGIKQVKIGDLLKWNKAS